MPPSAGLCHRLSVPGVCGPSPVCCPSPSPRLSLCHTAHCPASSALLLCFSLENMLLWLWSFLTWWGRRKKLNKKCFRALWAGEGKDLSVFSHHTTFTTVWPPAHSHPSALSSPAEVLCSASGPVRAVTPWTLCLGPCSPAVQAALGHCGFRLGQTSSWQRHALKPSERTGGVLGPVLWGSLSLWGSALLLWSPKGTTKVWLPASFVLFCFHFYLLIFDKIILSKIVYI